MQLQQDFDTESEDENHANPKYSAKKPDIRAILDNKQEEDDDQDVEDEADDIYGEEDQDYDEECGQIDEEPETNPASHQTQPVTKVE